ncbi:hypothetical protein HDV05_002512 [Chytridiales sp. JEL 0842]|nr:hypothetical protein HDV05_002512 [Chytridiales sp. JEL 0842]
MTRLIALSAATVLLVSSVTAQFPGFPGGFNQQNPPIFCNGAPTFVNNALTNADIFPLDAAPPTFALDYCTCNSICASTPTCDFFVFRPAQNQCSQKQLINRDSGAFTWFYTTAGGSAFVRGDLPGYDITSQQTNSREECASQVVFQGGNAATMLPIDNGRLWGCFIKRLPNENPSQPGSVMGSNNRGAGPVVPVGPQQCRSNLMPPAIDIVGFDLWSTGDSPSTCFCENQCRLRPNCDFFIQRNRACWVKTLQRKQDNVFTWFKTASCQGGSSFLKGTIDGFDIATTQVNNVQECQQQCRANSECLYISVQPVNPSGGPLFCFLKRINPSSADTIMGIVDRDGAQRFCNGNQFPFGPFDDVAAA